MQRLNGKRWMAIASRAWWFLAVAMMSSIALSADDAEDKAQARRSIERGLAFIASDAVAWRTKYKCVSCHHAGLAIWAMHESHDRGLTVDVPLMNELTRWVAESGSGKTGVPRPEGIPKALNAKAVWLGLGLAAVQQPDETTTKGLKLMLGTVREDQLENGSWASWPVTRPPSFGNSDDSMTALATLTLQSGVSGDDATKQARDRGVTWLAETKTDDDPQSVAMRLVLWSRVKRPQAEIDQLAAKILTRQRSDGGWSQTNEMESDAWATGQALYAMAHAGMKSTNEAIARGRRFLIKTQKENGSWPMTSRPTKPGGEGSGSLIPITGAGAAWAVLGMVQSEPKPLPKQVDLRPLYERWKLTPQAQGRRNTCSVFVTVGAFEFALSKRHDQGMPLSVEYANWACNRVIRNSTVDRGQFFHDLLKGYDRHGMCRDELMPYESKFQNTAPSEDAKANAQQTKELGFRVHWIRPWSKESGLTDQQFDEIRHTLARGWPVCAGSDHSRLFVGYVDDPNQAGGGKFITRDSGIGRHGEVTYEWTRRHVYDLFWVELPEKDAATSSKTP